MPDFLSLPSDFERHQPISPLGLCLFTSQRISFPGAILEYSSQATRLTKPYVALPVDLIQHILTLDHATKNCA